MLDQSVHYDSTNTTRALAGTGHQCPALDDYLDVLVRYVLDVTRRGAAPPELDDAVDPLD
jgi:hypothetical protein